MLMCREYDVFSKKSPLLSCQKVFDVGGYVVTYIILAAQLVSEGKNAAAFIITLDTECTFGT
jgi:hypothetical protein